MQELDDRKTKILNAITALPISGSFLLITSYLILSLQQKFTERIIAYGDPFFCQKYPSFPLL